MVHSKENKIPPRSVPKTVAYPDAEKSDTACYKRSEMIAELFSCGGGKVFHSLGGGHGKENIILEPCSQRNVPSFPELRDRS